jgi:hypothetical protein
VPETVQLPAPRLPVVVIAPEDETTPPHEVLPVTKVTAAFCPVVTSWPVNADDAVVVVVPVTGALWTMVTRVTVRRYDQAPESPAVSLSVPETVQLVPACRPPVVVIAPRDETATPQCGSLTMPKVTVPFCPVVTRWSVNAHEPVVVVVPVVGALWAMVIGVTVRV